MSSRPIWSIEQVPDSQGYTEKPCIEKPQNETKLLLLGMEDFDTGLLRVGLAVLDQAGLELSDIFLSLPPEG